MKTIKTADAIGPVLDHLVAKAKNLDAVVRDKRVFVWVTSDECPEYSPSTYWDQGGPIIDDEKIDIEHHMPGGPLATKHKHGYAEANGPTALIAAMRCFVTSRLGDEVEVPGELL